LLGLDRSNVANESIKQRKFASMIASSPLID